MHARSTSWSPPSFKSLIVHIKFVKPANFHIAFSKMKQKVRWRITEQLKTESAFSRKCWGSKPIWHHSQWFSSPPIFQQNWNWEIITSSTILSMETTEDEILQARDSLTKQWKKLKLYAFPESLKGHVGTESTAGTTKS